jgi:iron complex outermembrane receptor protein
LFIGQRPQPVDIEVLRGDARVAGNGGAMVTTAGGRDAGRRGRGAAALPMLAGLLAADLAAAQSAQELLELSLEQLGDVQVSSVSRREERWVDAPASLHVISGEDVRRAGARSLPEALRLAPNLQVARVSAGGYAISARGFNNSLGNKLLVLVDGRSVYTPLFSGVFWDAQAVEMEHVERIEVISGPGATLWGANAVNGVINVITRRAGDASGGLVEARHGSDGRALSLRRDFALGTGSARVHASQQRFDASEDATGAALPDALRRNHAGMRADWGEPGDGFGLQAAGYRGNVRPGPLGRLRLAGHHVLAFAERPHATGGSRLQFYVERIDRDDPLLFHDRMSVVDVEYLRHAAQGRHRLVWGAGVRRVEDQVEAGALTAFLPPRRTLLAANVFLQDTYALGADVDLIAGLKLDRNRYTGVERLPNLRVAWRRDPHSTVWASLARAVRAPSRIDREFFLPPTPPFLIAGGPEFRSETADVAEIGWRARPHDRLSWSLTLFHHRHDRLRSGEPQPDGTFQVQNGTAGRTSGLEAWAGVQLGQRTRVELGTLQLRHRFHTKPGSNDPDGAVDLGNDPRSQWLARASFDLASAWQADLHARRIGSLPQPEVPAYTAIDAGVAWQPRPQLELRLFGRDVFGGAHPEFAPGPLVARSEFGREWSLQLQWRW